MSGIKPGTVFAFIVKNQGVFSAQSVIQFSCSVSYHIHKGVLHMSPRQKILAIRLTDKLAKNPEYARTIGVEITNTKKEAENNENRN